MKCVENVLNENPPMKDFSTVYHKNYGIILSTKGANVCWQE
jgi:hypothetical protein